MLVMLLGGLWHGASWNFVIWGGIHGGMLAFERSQGRHGMFNRLPRLAQIILTFLIVVFAWVFFRARDLPSALAYCQSMLGLGTPQAGAGLIAGVIYQPYYLLSVLLAARGHLGRRSDLGLDPHAHRPKGRRHLRAVLGFPSGHGHPSLQSLHLFHLLRHVRLALHEAEPRRDCRDGSRQHLDHSLNERGVWSPPLS